jgi:hypothetical protein
VDPRYLPRNDEGFSNALIMINKIELKRDDGRPLITETLQSWIITLNPYPLLLVGNLENRKLP